MLIAQSVPRTDQARLPVVAPPRPGTRLRAAVEKVLENLTQPGADAELVAGLAWTAACGETCQVMDSVARVRAAVVALNSHDWVAAEAALVASLHLLPHDSAVPAPRVS